jgi:hypothetical protein
MRRITAVVLSALCWLVVTCAAAQAPAPSWNPRTGDAWVDRALADINRYGSRYPDAFADELTRYFGAPPALLASLLDDAHWAPGDVYYACALAQVAGQPCRAVTDLWARSHDAGWGAIARRLGVAPDSARAARLRHALAASYAHWGRPLPGEAIPVPAPSSATPVPDGAPR